MDNSWPVVWFRSRTSAPSTYSPVASSTVPLSAPVLCPNAELARRQEKRIAMAMELILAMIPLVPSANRRQRNSARRSCLSVAAIMREYPVHSRGLRQLVSQSSAAGCKGGHSFPSGPRVPAEVLLPHCSLFPLHSY